MATMIVSTNRHAAISGTRVPLSTIRSDLAGDGTKFLIGDGTKNLVGDGAKKLDGDGAKFLVGSDDGL